MKQKLYPDSGIELNPFISKHYDGILAVASMGRFPRALKSAIGHMEIQPGDSILDLGCGTGYNSQQMAESLDSTGRVLGLDISEEMAGQFEKRFAGDHRLTFKNQRIDLPFSLDRKFTKVFISFVIHGFPHEVRQVIIQNARSHLLPGGSFFILDFAEFDMDLMPPLHRSIFKAVECKYAFDYIKRDWKSILRGYGFNQFHEYHFLRSYVRLLEATQIPD